jgi:hypothetical protein
VFEALQKGDRNAAVDALRDQFRASKLIPQEEKDLLAPPGTGWGNVPVTQANGDPLPKGPSPAAWSVVMPGCNPPCAPPIANEIGGLDDTVKVLESGP